MLNSNMERHKSLNEFMVLDNVQSIYDLLLRPENAVGTKMYIVETAWGSVKLISTKLTTLCYWSNPITNLRE